MTQRRKILIVEQDTFLAGIYAAEFEKEGFEVLHATDGELGLKGARKESPDVILLDVALPKLDGLEVLEKLKADKNTEPIPVIVLTNLGQREDAERGLTLGAADYLIKTHFMPEETVARVKRVLPAS